MVPTDEYVRRMTEYWTSEYQLATSSALQDAWWIMARTFNIQIAEQNPKPWQVLPLPTGTGKTLGLAVFCSMLSDTRHPGVLIACRMQDQANELAERINQFAERQVALAHHAKSRRSFNECRSAPVLIVTHEAYRRVMDARAQGDTLRSNWDQFVEWQRGTRKLTVVDEALDIFEHAKLELRDLHHAAATLRRAFPDQAEVAHGLLHRFCNSLEHLTASNGKLNPASLVWPTESEAERIIQSSIEPFLEMITKASAWRFATAGISGDIVQLDKERCRLALVELKKLLLLSPRANRIGVRTTLNAARLVLPETPRAAVILDATARVDPVYPLIRKWAEIVEVPAAVRSYRNVLARVSTGHRMGKEHLRKEGDAALAKLFPELQQAAGRQCRMLLLGHKPTELRAVRFTGAFAKFDAAHWGALDGLNDWESFDTVAVFGLPYYDDASVECVLSALGCEPRCAAVRDYKRGIISKSLVQGINRVRCRRGIDRAGNCEPTTVYLLLPAEELAVAIMRDIRREMPGVTEVPWTFDVARRRVKPSGYEEPLVRYFEQAAEGTIRAAQVREELDIPSRSFERLTANVKSGTGRLADRLAELGVRYIGGGGRAGALFIVGADKGDQCLTA